MQKNLSEDDVATIISGLMNDNNIKVPNVKLRVVLDKYDFTYLKKLVSMHYHAPPKGGKDYFLVYYQITKTSAHWCSMVIDYKKKELFFYCSHGIYIDNHILVSDDKDRTFITYIARYLYKNGYDIHYNSYKLQEFDVNTCGRYAALFLLYNVIGSSNPDQFNSLIVNNDYGFTPDEYIYHITEKYA